MCLLSYLLPLVPNQAQTITKAANPSCFVPCQLLAFYVLPPFPVLCLLCFCKPAIYTSPWHSFLYVHGRAQGMLVCTDFSHVNSLILHHVVVTGISSVRAPESYQECIKITSLSNMVFRKGHCTSKVNYFFFPSICKPPLMCYCKALLKMQVNTRFKGRNIIQIFSTTPYLVWLITYYKHC